jgi:HlyD family secretion protein
MSSSRRGRSLLAGATLLIAMASVLVGCTDDAPSGIEVAPVDRATVTELVEAPATVQARAAVAVSAPASGRVAKLAVRDGVQVRAGQVLLTIESPSARAALQQAEQADAQLAASSRISVPRAGTAVIDASQTSARRAFEAARVAARAIPDAAAQRAALADVAAAEAEHTAALASARRTVRQVNAGLAGLARLAGALGQAQRIQTRAAVTAARATVDSLTVRAPISGVVTLGGSTGGGSASAAQGTDLLDQLPADLRGQAQSLLGTGPAAATDTGGALEVGLPVSTGSPLLTLTDVSAWRLVASVDETDVPLVKAGVSAEVELDAMPGQSLAATVASVDLQPTASTRGGVSYQVRLELSFPPGTAQVRAALRPGMSAVTRLQVRTAEDAVSVPPAAVFRDESGEAVWVVRDEVARRQAVRLGAQGLDRVEVTQGLTVGDRVVVRGADAVTAGATVPP